VARRPLAADAPARERPRWPPTCTWRWRHCLPTPLSPRRYRRSRTAWRGEWRAGCKARRGRGLRRPRPRRETSACRRRGGKPAPREGGSRPQRARRRHAATPRRPIGQRRQPPKRRQRHGARCALHQRDAPRQPRGATYVSRAAPTARVAAPPYARGRRRPRWRPAPRPPPPPPVVPRAAAAAAARRRWRRRRTRCHVLVSGGAAAAVILLPTSTPTCRRLPGGGGRMVCNPAAGRRRNALQPLPVGWRWWRPPLRSAHACMSPPRASVVRLAVARAGRWAPHPRYRPLPATRGAAGAPSPLPPPNNHPRPARRPPVYATADDRRLSAAPPPAAADE